MLFEAYAFGRLRNRRLSDIIPIEPRRPRKIRLLPGKAAPVGDKDMTVITAEDRINDCIRIRRAVFVAEQGVPEELEIDEKDGAGSGCDHFLMLDCAGRPFGTFRAYYETETNVHLQRFCILKEMRGLGFGREALRFVEEHYAPLGAEKIVLGAQCTAVPFYEKCGYTAVSEVFLDAGMPHRMMEKTISVPS